MSSKQIRQKYLDFFRVKGHAQIPPAKLVLENDPTTLFVSSGMQPLVPYLLGKVHPQGKRLVNSQPCFRSEDIMNVGDNRHTTFFEMLGNWSLGDYSKKEQLEWFFKFLTVELKLNPDKLYVTVFGGDGVIPKDDESAKIWQSLGIKKDHIFFYAADKNWWSRFGSPKEMPVDEIGGPDSEVFYEFTQVKHDRMLSERCHPNCDCGRFSEIGNSVFIKYQKVGDNEFKKLPQQNVDFGGGLERLTAATNANPDIFQIDLNKPIIRIIEQQTKRSYRDRENQAAIRIITDHLKAATLMIVDGVIPSNKLHGYVLRRLLRRSAVKVHQLTGGLISGAPLVKVSHVVLQIYDGLFDIRYQKQRDLVERIIAHEIARFGKSLNRGLREIEKIDQIDGKLAFNLYQTFGFPFEVTEELFLERGQKIDHRQFEGEFKKHQEFSRAGAGKFAGGLAGHSETEIKYHTATHLLHQALRDVLGPQVFQKGSNINFKRLRFDFSFDRKLTDEEIKAVEKLVNQKIQEDLKVDRMFLSVAEAKKLNAISLFDEKYQDKVSIYAIGPNYNIDPAVKDQRYRGGYYSLEFCGGPHVEHTGQIERIRITEEEAVSSGVRRIRAELVG